MQAASERGERRMILKLEIGLQWLDSSRLDSDLHAKRARPGQARAGQGRPGQAKAGQGRPGRAGWVVARTESG